MPLYDKSAAYVEYDAHTNRYILMVSKANPLLPFTRLLGYALTAPNLDLSNPVTIPKAVYRNGQIFTVNKTVRNQAARKYTWTLGWPSGNWIMTPIGRLAENLSSCLRDFFLLYLCPDDNCKAHFWVLPESSLGPITPGDMITVGDDAAALEATSSLDTIDPQIYVYVRQRLAQDVEEPLHAVAYCEAECSQCEAPNQVGIYGGRDVTGTTPLIERTINAFASGVDITPLVAVIPATHYVLGLLCEDNVIIAAHADDPDLATATAGGLAFSNNSGATWDAGVLLTGGALTVAFNAVIRADAYYYAVGAGNAIFRSLDGVNWEQITVTATPATTDWYAAAYDAAKNIVYLAGYDATGTAGVAATLQDEAVSDITSLVGAGTAELFSVAVLSGDHVIFGDGSGRLHEHPFASEASASNPYSLTASGLATTVEIRTILGNKFRTIVGGGTSIMERSPLTNKDFQALNAIAGSTLAGNITAGAVGSQYGNAFPGLNTFVLVTDAGEIAVVASCYSYQDA